MLKQFHQTKQAVGSDVTLVLVADSGELRIDKLFIELWSSIFKFERQFSRFLPSSELSIFNRLGGQKKAISPDFKKLLIAAKEMADFTDGLYNPFILPALQRAGYKKSFLPGHENDIQDDYSNRIVVSAIELEIGDDWAKIPFGTSIDLGGCGKGYLADQLASDLPNFVQGFWFSLGGDIIAGGQNDLSQPWTVHIANDVNLEEQKPFVFQPDDFEKFAVATSGTNIRQGVNDKKTKWHHIIDPRTLLPSTSDIQLASIYCKSALKADVLASSAIIVGSDEAIEFLKSHNVQASLLQTVSNEDISYGDNLKSVILNREKTYA
jgi:thiamine biosynthesis lipoprotein